MKSILLLLLLPLTLKSQKLLKVKKELSLQYIDNAVKPGDNFFMYANGKWIDTATISPTETSAGARLEMTYLTYARIKEILEETAVTKNIKGSIRQKVGDFFASGMDTFSIEQLSYTPLKSWLQDLQAIQNVKGLIRFIAQQTTMGNPTLFSVRVGPGHKNSQKNISIFSQSGLGMPNRNYYFATDTASKTLIDSYRHYVVTLFGLTGDDPLVATKNAAIVFNLEKQIAAGHRTPAELRNPQTNNNNISVPDLEKQMPAIGWKELLTILRINPDTLNIKQPQYYATLNELLVKAPISEWKTYLRFHLLNTYATVLSSDFVNASFEYNQKRLLGQKVLKERWVRNFEFIDAHIGEALGELYVSKYFTVDSKQRMQELVKNISRAFENRVTRLDWMSDSTKQKAIKKLHTFDVKVGYPDKWKDYSKVEISRDNFFKNIIASRKNLYDLEVSKLGKPVDKTEWRMTPTTNNAYFTFAKNEIVFPAGILQFPMFDVNSDDAMNYGGIGVTIGHEITHGFDDNGSQYDKEGNLNNWWLKEDYDKFQAKGEQVVKLYNSFTVLDTLHINGRLTLGENIADIGGLAIAYEAFKLTKQGKEGQILNGLTPDQRFFLSYAQCWRRKVKDEAVRQQVNTDPHTPTFYRVTGSLMNFTPFYKAFQVKEGDKMFLSEKDRINIW